MDLLAWTWVIGQGLTTLLLLGLLLESAHEVQRLPRKVARQDRAPDGPAKAADPAACPRDEWHR